MKKVISIVLVLVLFVFAMACSNEDRKPPVESPPTENNNEKQIENEIEPNDYEDLGGANDVKLYPTDDASQNPSFESFRKELLHAIEQKDVAFIKEHLDENIKYSFGINDKVSGFLKEWKLDTEPNRSQFWHELNQVLLLGGTFNDNEKTIFTAPYIFTEFPEDLDAFQHHAVIDKNVLVYSDSDINSDIDGELNYSIVKITERDVKPINGEADLWIKIETLSGNTGYILNKYARSPIHYRASFRYLEDTWKLMFFVAGD